MKKIAGKKSVMIALAMLLAVAVIGEAETELVVWHGYRGAEKDAFEKVTRTYSAATAGVTIKTLAVPYDAYADKITAAIPRGKGPDIFIFAQDRLGGWVEAGKTIESLDFFVDDKVKARFLPTTMAAMIYQDTVWGLPLNFKCITLIYNKDLVAEPPVTSGELVKLAKQLTDQKVGKFGLAYPYADFYYHAALMNAFGGGVFDSQNRPTLNSPANIRSFELMMTWADKEGILPAEPSTALITALFNEGRAAMVFSGPWFLGEVKPSINVGLAPLPSLDEAGGKPMKPWMTVEGVYLSASSKSPDKAYSFILYLTGVEATTVLALEGGQTPANQAVYDNPKVANHPILSGFRTQVGVAVPMPNLAEMAMVWSPATTAMNATVKGSATPKAALDQAQKEVEERIAKLHK